MGRKDRKAARATEAGAPAAYRPPFDTAAPADPVTTGPPLGAPDRMAGAPLSDATTARPVSSGPPDPGPSSVELAPAVVTDPPEPVADPVTTDRGLEVSRTRTSSAWVGVAAVLVLLIVIIDFIVQNLNEATLHLFGAHFRLPIGILVLSAAVAGGVVVLIVGVARLAQLRLVARRHRRAH